jgi:hypothetical protein
MTFLQASLFCKEGRDQLLVAFWKNTVLLDTKQGLISKPFLRMRDYHHAD